MAKKITFGFSESDRPQEIKKLKKYKTKDTEKLTFFAKEEGKDWIPFATMDVVVDSTGGGGGGGEIPTCPAGQHYDEIAEKCVDDVIEPPPSEDEFINRYSFVGDLDIDDDPNAQKKVDFIKATNTAFIANGDYYADTDSSGNIAKFTQVFDQLKPITVIVTKGNHDDEEDGSSKVAQAMNQYFGWSSIATSAHVSPDGKYAIIGMDSQDRNITKQDGQQYQYVKQTLESEQFQNAVYRFVVIHKNLVSAEGKHANLDDVREVYHPLFVTNKVTGVIQAHDHNMWVSKLIDQITYIGNGAGGRSHHAIGENPATIEWSNDSTYGLGLIREHKTDANKLQIKFIDFNGKTIFAKVLSFGPVVEPEPCPQGQHRDPATGQCVPDVVIPEPEEPPTSGTILYDSNTDIDWAGMNGKVKLVTDTYGNQSANGKGFHMNASGDPRMFLDPATKELMLEHDGKYGRAYFCVCNYQSRLECDFMLDDKANGASFKLRNRHQYAEQTGTNPPNTQKQGGQGCGIHYNEVDCDLEVYHGSEIGGPSATLSPVLEIGQWHSLKFSQYDKDGKIHVVVEINGKVVNEGDVNAPSQFFNKAEFEGWSEFWVRLNAAQGGRLKIKNLKLFAL